VIFLSSFHTNSWIGMLPQVRLRQIITTSFQTICCRPFIRRYLDLELLIESLNMLRNVVGLTALTVEIEAFVRYEIFSEPSVL
jgi:hypothetical protein